MTNKPSNVLTIPAHHGDTKEQAIARATLLPEVGAAQTIKTFSSLGDEIELNSLADELKAQSQKGMGGDLTRLESMLMNQALTLDCLFNAMAQKAIKQEYTQNLELYFRLALKSQDNCRKSILALSELKNPKRAFFIRQQNNAQNLQVNNGPTTASPEAITSQSPPILEHTHGETLDTRGTGKTSGINTELATMAALERPKD